MDYIKLLIRYEQGDIKNIGFVINLLNDLIKRGEGERAKLQDITEQKEMDEFSTRKYR